METNEAQLHNPLFKVHKLTPEAMTGAKRLGLMFQDFYEQMHALVFDGKDGDTPGWEGREWAIVKTKLEEAAFYAKKAFASQPGHSE